MDSAKTSWSFLTNHATVLLCIYARTVGGSTPVRVRDIAEHVGVTTRTVHHILNDLEDAGYITRQRVGNRTHYELHENLPLRIPADQDLGVDQLLNALAIEPDLPTRAGLFQADPGGTGMVAADHVTGDGIQRALHVMRTHLGLDVAFVSHVHDGERVFTHVDTSTDPPPIEVGGSDAVEDSYCHYVIRGEVPELLVDPSLHPITSRIEATKTLPVGTHLSVPIELASGDVYGTCCSFSYGVKDRIDERDLAAVRMLARLVATHLDAREHSS
jgi:DNA-binding transcriptional ArsR family regulator